MVVSYDDDLLIFVKRIYSILHSQFGPGHLQFGLNATRHLFDGFVVWRRFRWYLATVTRVTMITWWFKARLSFTRQIGILGTFLKRAWNRWFDEMFPLHCCQPWSESSGGWFTIQIGLVVHCGYDTAVFSTLHCIYVGGIWCTVVTVYFSDVAYNIVCRYFVQHCFQMYLTTLLSYVLYIYRWVMLLAFGRCGELSFS